MSSEAAHGPPDARLAAGAALYNEGRFWHAHEAWEELWLDARHREELGLANAVQGLILATAAFENMERGKPSGASTQLGKAIDRLERHGSTLAQMGVVDVDGFTAGLRTALTALDEGAALTEAPPLTLR